MDRSTLYFALLFIGICVLFAGAGTWFVTADKDYHFHLDHESDTVPQHADFIRYYDGLNEGKQRRVDRAIGGKYLVFETESKVPPSVIKKKGTFYVFSSYYAYDWLNPATFGPAMLAVGGLGLMIKSAQLDLRYRRIR